MATDYEWVRLDDSKPEAAGPGTEYGENTVDDHAITFGGNVNVILEGSRKQLYRFGRSVALAFADAAPDGPAVTFDREAFRAWCRAPHSSGHGTNGEYVLGGEYNSFVDDPSHLAENLVHDMRSAPGSLVYGPGVSEVNVWRTADSDGPDGGAMVEVTVDGIDVSAGQLPAGDLVYGDTDGEGRLKVPMVDAAELALTSIANAASRAVARFRAVTIRPAGDRPASGAPEATASA